MTASCPLSIIAAVTESDAAQQDPATSCAPWLAALLREARSVDAELILVSRGSAGAGILRSNDGEGIAVRAIAGSRTALTPELWGTALTMAVGRNVAFTIDQVTVEPGWAEAIQRGLSGADVGVGGPIALGPNVSSTGRAIYYLRYASFLGGGKLPRQVRDVAGDNAGYRRDALMRDGRSYAHGFWEVEAHHWLRAAGETLAMVPGMGASFSQSPRLGSFMRQRFAHGRHFGAWRVAVGRQSPVRIALAAPLVPVLLLLRTARTITRAGHGLGDLLRVVGPFLSLAGAWALGEGVGAVRPIRRDLGPQPSGNA